MSAVEELIAEAQVWDKQYRDQMIAIAPNSMVGVMLRLAAALATSQADLASRDALLATAPHLGFCKKLYSDKWACDCWKAHLPTTEATS